MPGVRRRGEAIREYILGNVQDHPQDIVSMAAKQFGVTRQAISKHIRMLGQRGDIDIAGTTRSRWYSLRFNEILTKIYQIDDKIQEHVVWREDIEPLLDDLPKNIVDIWGYCFTEIFNNAIDHSGGTSIVVCLQRNVTTTELEILDDGEGIFTKIARELGLVDERHAVLELGKGKLTTDPVNHSGEGIFFSSKMVDSFYIRSGSVNFQCGCKSDFEWIGRGAHAANTYASMRLQNDSALTTKEIFDEYTDPTTEDYGFIKTVVPVSLVQYGREMLVSRSQAKRLLTGLDKFRTVILDFQDIEAIGQAFADEIFRVFVNRTPGTRITPINMTEAVQKMVIRAL